LASIDKKDVLDTIGALTKLGSGILQGRELLDKDSGKPQPISLAGVGPRGGAAAPVEWNRPAQRQAPRYYAQGGVVRDGGLSGITIALADRLRNSGLLRGEAGGQDDVVDIRAAPGEYVFDADVVAALGDGNTEAGARKLDQMRQNIRTHKRGGSVRDIPPPAKNIEDYMRGAK
jgi:hypothetical protein